MGGAGKSTYFLTVFLEMPSCLVMPLRGTPCSLARCTASQGLLAWRCLPGWLIVRGGGLLIIRRLVGGCSQGGQALQLRPGETMLAEVPDHPGQFGSRGCQGRADFGPSGRRKSVPPRVVGQHKCPHQLFRGDVPLTAAAEGIAGETGRLQGESYAS